MTYAPLALHRDALSRPLASPQQRVLSLGAGVQSSTLALMAARGDLPRVDYAVFADTGWEPQAVYDWLAWLETQLPFEVVRVKRDGLDLGELALAVARGDRPREGSSIPPWYVLGENGKQQLPLQCSKEFKTRVITAEVRRRLGLEPGRAWRGDPVVEMWIGMSTDELERLKDHEQAAIQNRWPLIEARMNRTDCLIWMEQRQYPQPPKSSCVFCPLRDNAAWLRMKAEAMADYERACLFDEAIRPGFAGMEGEAFVHRRAIPLRQITADDRDQGDLFRGECEGMCGV